MNYPEPREIVLQLTLKDVFLNFFVEQEEIISNLLNEQLLRSGTRLYVREGALFMETQQGMKKVVAFSRAFNQTLMQLQYKGYVPYSATVRFVVGWTRQDRQEMTEVILPDIWFRKL